MPLLCGCRMPRAVVCFSAAGRQNYLARNFLSNRVFCWLAGTAAVIAWHIPTLLCGNIVHTWHIVEEVCFLCDGLLFWRPIIRAGRREAKGSMVQCRCTLPRYIALRHSSAFLILLWRVVLPNYVSAARIVNLSPSRIRSAPAPNVDLLTSPI